MNLINNKNMKNISKYIMYFVAAVFVFTACEKDIIEPLSGKYPVPEEYPLTKLIAQKAVKEEGRRLFTLQLATGNLSATYNESTDSYTYSGSGQFLSVVFVGNDYYLKEGNYTFAPNSAPRVGSYIAGYDNAGGGTCFFDVNNGAATGRMVSDGTISVTQDGDYYTIGGMLALSDQSIVTVNFAGNILYEEDPPEMTYSLATQAPYSYSQGGPPIVVPGTQLNQLSIFSDGLLIAYLEIVTAENPASLTGSYSVADPATGQGEAVIGFYMDLSMYGMGIMQGGSYVIDDDGVTKLYIRGGTISVTDNAGVLTITANDLPLQDITTGFDFGLLPFSGTVNAQNAIRAINYSYTVDTEAPYSYTQDGMSWVTIEGSQLNKLTVYADGVSTAYFEVITAPALTSLAGTYPLKDPVDGLGQIAVGSYMNMSWFGGPDMDIEGGSYYLEHGEKQFIRAGGGDITISDNNGVLDISGSNLVIQDVNIPFWGTKAEPGNIDIKNIKWTP